MSAFMLCSRTMKGLPGWRWGLVAWVAVLSALASRLISGHAQGTLPGFDFQQPGTAQGWGSAHDISSLQTSGEGLVVTISGADPYFSGPSRNYPIDTPLWLRIRLKSEQGGGGQVFYFSDYPREENSVRFAVPAGVWYEAKLRLPSLGLAYRLRIDPPGTGGTCVLASLKFEERYSYPAPAWPKPLPPGLGANDLAIWSGALRLVHARTAFGALEVWVGDRLLAVGNSKAQIGYASGTVARWVSLDAAAGAVTSAQPHGEGLAVTTTATDPDGGHWQWRQIFTPSAMPGTIGLEGAVTVDRDRQVLYLPLFTLLPGAGSFGTNKTQALLAGVEYLENEPSSSKADLTGPAAQRQVVDTHCLTMPLMALSAEDRYLGLIWEPKSSICAVFDSPDRLFGSGGHLLGLLFPGSDSTTRDASSLLPYGPEPLRAQQALTFGATLIGGSGRTVVPAVQRYVELKGLPALPGTASAGPEYFDLAAHGWLDSRIRQGNLYSHAVGGSFGAGPSADAALYMDWLALRVADTNLRSRLSVAARDALAQVSPPAYNATQIGHVRYPAPCLAYGAASENAAAALAYGRSLLARFEPDGSVWYRKPAQGTDYGKTHFAPDANGLTAGVVASLLEASAFAGDGSLTRDAVARLRAMAKFRDTIPRGAQTWEIPLHTPDILASAYLLRAYTLGYELTGDPDFLGQARYWAWTGVPFVYLRPPTSLPVGVYSAIPVLGATGWVAPVWIGLPVQWCGLVYADALYRFGRHDPGGPWLRLADGIAAAGVQHTHPLSEADNQGLLPDSFDLVLQVRNAPPINPATLLAPALRLFRAPMVYDFRCWLAHGLCAHAPGAIVPLEEQTASVKFQIQAWSPRPYYLLVNGFKSQPRLRIGDRDVPVAAPHVYQSAEGRLILRLEGQPTVELLYPAPAALRIQPTGPGNVKVLWPRSVTNWVLQTSHAGLNSAWADLPAPVLEESGYRYISDDSDSNLTLYRLRAAY